MTKKSSGKVTLPLDEYNDLYARVVALENSITFSSYSDDIEMEVDLAPFEGLVLELLKEKFPNAEIKGDKKYAFILRSGYFAEKPHEDNLEE